LYHGFHLSHTFPIFFLLAYGSQTAGFVPLGRTDQTGEIRVVSLDLLIVGAVHCHCNLLVHDLSLFYILQVCN
ncbi:hypothetical protein, partial [Salmonella enterica]|uniref:hypothetical protein n=1 Tax=Salmonella enterica TaxID=28901 RepID=UPI001CA40B37